jgi:hypothetical protein
MFSFRDKTYGQGDKYDFIIFQSSINFGHKVQ